MVSVVGRLGSMLNVVRIQGRLCETISTRGHSKPHGTDPECETNG